MVLPDPKSTYAGKRLTVTDVLPIAFAAGFRTEEQLLTVVSLAVAESSLWTACRNWDPANGLRPSTDVIGVPGPVDAWVANRQMHSDRGLWQINSRWWPEFNDFVCDTPHIAALIMFKLSRSGTDFSFWNAYKSGAAKKHWDAAYNGWPALRPLVQAFLSSVGNFK